MAAGHNVTDSDKLKVSIDDLRRDKGKKSDVNECDDEFQDSFEKLSEKGESENPISKAAAAHNN